MQLSDQNDF